MDTKKTIQKSCPLCVLGALSGEPLMRTVWTFHSAGSLVFGRGAVEQLGEITLRLPARRVFVVTDATLEKAGVVDRTVKPLRDVGANVEVFNGGRAEPSLKLVAECTGRARAFGPDTVFGLGGGSNMDVAKMTAVLLCHGGEARDYLRSEEHTSELQSRQYLVCRLLLE